MEDDWQKLAEEEEIPAPKVPVAELNKWAGEDEDDDIKDSWDADDDEKKDEEKSEDQQPAKPKKTLQQKIAEKEQKRVELEEKRRKEREDEEMANMTPEERTAEKLRLRKLQEEADLKISLDTLGLGTSSSDTLDSFNPSTPEEFTEYSDALCKKIRQHKAKEGFPNFLDELVRTLCAGQSSSSIRKIKTSLDNLFLEQQKIEKGDKPKKKAATKVKARLRIEGDDDYNSRAGAFEADDYDDFM